MQLGLAVTSPVATSRFAAFDRLRGLIMVLMAVDHASYFIARVHPFESWAWAPPFYAARAGAGVGVAFVTRWLTHLCAPGFFMLMGAGMVWLHNARKKNGWSDARIRRFLITRGMMLLVIQHLVENPAWVVGALSATGMSFPGTPGGGTAYVFHFGVISALAASMIVWALLIEAPSIAVLAVSAAALALSVAMTPSTASLTTLFPIWKLLLFVPAHHDLVNVLYPFVPWLAATGLGILFARLVTKRPDETAVAAAGGGAALLLIFVMMRAAGFGDPHPPLPGFIGFMSLTKYPPSPAFLAVTLGADLVLLAVLTMTARGRSFAPLEAFGRSPLFFYLLHLYVFGALSFAFPTGTSFPAMYAVWAAAVITMYPACLWYARFKASKPLESVWRLL